MILGPLISSRWTIVYAAETSDHRKSRWVLRIYGSEKRSIVRGFPSTHGP